MFTPTFNAILDALTTREVKYALDLRRGSRRMDRTHQDALASLGLVTLRKAWNRPDSNNFRGAFLTAAGREFTTMLRG